MQKLNKNQNMTKCKFMINKSKSSQVILRSININSIQKTNKSLNTKPSLNKNVNTQNSIKLKQSFGKIKAKQRVLKASTIYPTFCIKVQKLSLNKKQKGAQTQNLKMKQQIQNKKHEVTLVLKSKCSTSVKCLQQESLKFKANSTYPSLAQESTVFHKRQLKFNIVNIFNLKICSKIKLQQQNSSTQQTYTGQPQQQQLQQIISYSVKNQQNQLIPKQSKVTKDVQVQTFFYEDKYLQEYIKMRQVRFKSFQNLQAHFKYINQLGSFQQNLIQERQQQLQDFIQQMPLDDRQKRIFQMTRILELKENQMKNEVQKNIRDSKILQRKKEQIKIKYQSNYNQVISSINNLSKVIQKKLNQRSGQISNTKISRIFNRITKQVKHSSDIVDQMMWQYQKQEHLYNELKHLQFFKKYYLEWKNQYYQNQVLIRNCVRKLLDYGKTNYKLFGDKQQKYSECFSFKHKEQWRNQLLNKCQDCLNSRNKAKTIHLMNKALKPVIKVLNQMIRERQAQIFKYNSSLVDDDDSQTQINQEKILQK